MAPFIFGEKTMKMLREIIFEDRSDVIIACESYSMAKQAFLLFLNFLETEFPFEISELYESSNGVRTNDGLHYIFIDHRLSGKVGRKFDVISVNYFFEWVDNVYGTNYFLDYYLERI